MQNKILAFAIALFNHQDEQPAPKLNWQFIYGSLILLAAGLKLYVGVQNTMDVQYADEAAYIRFGLDLFEKMNRNWGPMYALWYKCLSVFTANTIQLYYLNFVITSIAVAILLYLFLCRISVHYSMALFVGFCVLISELNISVWPRVSHFCIIICLIALLIITYLRNNIYKSLIFTTACLINAYARPEFYLSFVLMIIVSVLFIYFKRKSITKKDYFLLAFAVVIWAVLHYIFRFPSNDFFGYNRGVAAFYQHYAWNLKMRTHGTFDAWLSWEDIAKKQFGDCNSMWCVIKTQPMVFISNTLFNIRTYLLQLLKVSSFIFPLEIFHGNKLKLLLTILLVLSFVLLLLFRPSRKYFIRNTAKLRTYLLLLFCFIFPTLISCVVVFPRDHYLYLQLPFFILILISAFGYFDRNFVHNSILFVFIGLLFLVVTPNIKKYSFLKMTTDSHTLCNKKLILHLQKEYSDKPHTIFTNMPFVRGLLPTTFKEVNTIFDKKKNKSFSYYLDSAKIDIVILTPSTLRDPHISSDSTWKYFMNNYEQFHFKKDVFCDCDQYLLVKED